MRIKAAPGESPRETHVHEMDNYTDVLYQYRLAPSASPEMEMELADPRQMVRGFHLPTNESQLEIPDYGNESLDYPNYQQMVGGPCRMEDNNISYWNLTCDSPLEYAMPLYGYCMPFLLIITIISNSLIVLVLSKKSMATPTNFVLMGKLNGLLFISII